MKKFLVFLPLLAVFAFVSCEEDEETFLPKPRAYYRIAFPEKKYVSYDSACPFRFEVPVYSKVEEDQGPYSQPCWLNVVYPQFRAQLHMSYHPLNNDLPKYLEDAYELAAKHQIKASGLEEQVVMRDSAKVYGLIYNIAGNTATSMQFYLTDSTRHFFRGSLYFNCAPNIDSLKIVVDFLKEDVLRLIQTFEWKDNRLPETKK